MAQASSQLQQLVNLIQDLSLPKLPRGALKQLSAYQVRGAGGWVLALTVVGAMLLWNWKLVLTTSAGVGVMLTVYRMQQWDWAAVRTNLRRFFSGSNRQLTLAVGSGGIATLSTYIAISIWLESESHWMATGLILQGGGTMATLILLVWQIISVKSSRGEASLNELLINLTDAEPLKRLISIRQITRLAIAQQLDKSDRVAIAEYFRLMLSRETEPIVRDAVLEGLQAVEKPNLLGKGVEAFSVHRAKKRSPVKVPRHLS